MIYGLFARRCSECGKGMQEGYLADGEYYCSDVCLRVDYTEAEWSELATDDSDEFYYTEWTEWDESDEELYTEDGLRVQLSMCQHDDYTWGKTLSESERERVVAVLCDHCGLNGWIREELLSGDSYQLEEGWGNDKPAAADGEANSDEAGR
ncbi:hypothetical protein KRR55_06225 [Paeniglutamicibacter sp. ABSL32-1]|uniref:hypothetical protein n=1 Tax=Paeniglutamicibacter quisquiliarum TaxID=2849498 RepID=UPI001C2DACDD|nr:hypothetical protein [Paeniglutamicibacter quisquiliarum]MBV1778708.1 hypothetical protein [Paeniglutamicibacter quisquiliarum]